MVFERLFDWLIQKKKDPAAIPDDLWHSVIKTLPFISCLDDNSLGRLRTLTESFLAEKEFATAGGLELTDTMCVSIAVQGCLPILNLGLGCYRGWVGIIVYPDEFVIPRTMEDEFGIVHQYDEVASGEAWEGGPLLISWHDAQMAGDGYNVVIHEFAHKLDMLNGEVDGIPPLPPELNRGEWEKTLTGAFEHFCERVDEAETHGEETQFDPYAAEHPGEFFAVMSETFFETPDILQAEYPALYAQFTRFYRQDPVKALCPDSSGFSDRTPV